MADMAQQRAAWAERFRAATESDPIIQCYAKYYSCDFLLDMEELRVGVQMRDGRVQKIEIDPAPLEPHHFSLHASAETWRKMSQKHPPPFFHGMWAASVREDLRIEGDITVLMQNLRNFTAQFELLRQVGVPV
ncbi:MAG: hypothetical protein QGI52_05975 [Alphaproteobacteria bacterium]|jgi:hypothetical protein|nr:hypothetical protein [Alphaproteobacteria bacterium]MDP7641982.1 hypothetical protein [Alphaproteobacteria bacterium]